MVRLERERERKESSVKQIQNKISLFLANLTLIHSTLTLSPSIQTVHQRERKRTLHINFFFQLSAFRKRDSLIFFWLPTGDFSFHSSTQLTDTCITCGILFFIFLIMFYQLQNFKNVNIVRSIYFTKNICSFVFCFLFFSP